jgi:hypothetical protein
MSALPNPGKNSRQSAPPNFRSGRNRQHCCRLTGRNASSNCCPSFTQFEECQGRIFFDFTLPEQTVLRRWSLFSRRLDVTPKQKRNWQIGGRLVAALLMTSCAYHYGVSVIGGFFAAGAIWSLSSIMRTISAGSDSRRRPVLRAAYRVTETLRPPFPRRVPELRQTEVNRAIL